VPPRRLALLVATYLYEDAGLRQLTAPGHDAEALAEVLRDPEIANFDVTILINEPHHVVGNAIGQFYRNRRRDDLTLLYFTGHGLKDDQGRLYLAMTNTKRDDLLFTGLSAQQIDEAMESCSSRQKVLVLDCCYSGAFPAGHVSKAGGQVNALEKFQGKGRVVLTASDATQYSFEGNHITGEGTQSVFTRSLVKGLTTGEADLDGDGDISIDELYSYVHDRVIEEMPQQRLKKQENIEGRIVVARNIHWNLPAYVHNAIESPVARDRLAVLEGLAHLHRVGNDLVQAEIINQTRRLIHDDSKAVSTAAMKLMTTLNPAIARREAEEQAQQEAKEQAQHEANVEAWREANEQTRRQAEEQARREANEQARRREEQAQRQANEQARRRKEQAQREAEEQARREANEQVRDAEQPRRGLAVSSSPPRHNWAEEKDEGQVVTSSTRSLPEDNTTTKSDQLERGAWADQHTQPGPATEKLIPHQRDTGKRTRREANRWTAPAWLLNLWAPPGRSPIASGTAGPGSFPLGVFTVGGRCRQALIAIGALLALGGVIILVVFVATNRAPSDSTPAPVPAPSAVPTPGPEVAIPAVGTSIAIGKTPVFVAVSPNGQHAYIANGDAQVITMIDTANNQVTATVPIKAGPPQFLAFAPDGRTLYVSIFNDQQTIHVIDVIATASNTVVATIPQPARPFLPAVTRDGKRLFVPNHDIASVSVVATDTNTIIGQIKVAPYPHWVAFSRDGSRAYTANHESNLVSVIDTATLKVVATIPVGNSPHSLAVHPDRPLVANVNFEGNTVTVIDTNTLKVVATIPVGKNPRDIVWAPDGRFAYVVNADSNTVSVIDAATNQVTATIPTEASPMSIAVLPNGRQAYVSNRDSGTLTVLILTG
jgi:YVTN family beta-propeller protein